MYIYIISNSLNHVKIGISKHPSKRVRQLQTGNQDTLTLLFQEEFECTRNHLLKIEKKLLRDLRNMTKAAKGEWFQISAEQLQSIQNTIIFYRIRYEGDTNAFSSYR